MPAVLARPLGAASLSLGAAILIVSRVAGVLLATILAEPPLAGLEDSKEAPSLALSAAQPLLALSLVLSAVHS